jgi:hypothetical protein
VNGIFHMPILIAAERVTGLVGRLEDLESLSAVLKHLRHEWKRIQAAPLIERCEDLVGASHLYPIPCTKSSRMVDPRLGVTHC